MVALSITICCQAQKLGGYEKFLHKSCKILSPTHPHTPILFHTDKSWDEWVVWPFPLCIVIGWLGSKGDFKKGNNVLLPGICDCQGAEKLICELPPCRSLGLCVLSVSWHKSHFSLHKAGRCLKMMLQKSFLRSLKIQKHPWSRLSATTTQWIRPNMEEDTYNRLQSLTVRKISLLLIWMIADNF